MFRRHVLKELSAYLDNQLSERKKLKVEGHLKDCQICSQELSKLKLLSEKLKTWQAPELSPNFDSAVRNEIVTWELQKGEFKMKKKTLAILIPSGVLAGILVLAFLGSSLNMYVKRNVQGKLRESSDKIGTQFSPGYKPYYYSGLDEKAFETGKASPSRSYGASYGEQLAKAGSVPSGDFYGGTSAETVAYWSDYEGRSDRVMLGSPRSFTNIEGSTYTGSPSNLAMNGSIAAAGEAWSAIPVAPTTEGTVIVIQPVLPATGEGEKIIRTAEVRLEVEDGKETYKKASEICQGLGGYLASSNFYKDAEGREAGTITMRIPKDKFLTALEKLGALGKLENSTTNSQDVSQEYINLKARLDAAMVVYKKTLEALQKKQTTIPEAMRLESELTPILQRVEELKNKIEYLNNAVSFTTITLYFHEPQVSAKVLKESRNYIKQSVLIATINAVRFFAQAIPVAIVVAIWLGIIIGVAFLVKYWIIRLFKKE